MANLLLVLFVLSFFGFLQVANAVGAAISELGKWDHDGKHEKHINPVYARKGSQLQVGELLGQNLTNKPQSILIMFH